MKKILAILLSLLFSFTAACKDVNIDNENMKEKAEENQTSVTIPHKDVTDDKKDKSEDVKEEKTMVTITVKDFGDMVLELYPEHAPETVANFLELAESGFYEGLVFHRIYKGFMIQGGSTDGIGISGSDKKIKGEFKMNGVNNPISHERGVISMARTNDPNSASSQFFICDADSTFLDGSYAAFGKLVEGYDVLDEIASVDVTYGPSGEKSSPLVAPVIEKVTVNK